MCVCVCVCVRVLVDQMHSVRQSVTAGCSTTLSSHYGSHTHTHTLTHGLGLRGGQHTETAVPTHTDQNNVFVRKENSFMGHTHTHTQRGWRPLSMPLFRTAQLSLCTSLFSLQFSVCLSVFLSLTVVLSFFICSHFFHSHYN